MMQCKNCHRQAEKSHKLIDGTIVYKQTCRTCRGRVENIKRKREISKQYYSSNKESELLRYKEWRKQNPAKLKDYRIKHKDKLKQHNKNRLKTDIEYKLRKYLRTRLYNAIKYSQKTGSAISSLGCTATELKLHLQSLWQPGMTWENHTKDGWHIDHIKPLSLFDLTNPEELKKACHYTNLQPLWAKDNLSKGDRYARLRKN